MADSLASEIGRRQSNTAKVWALFTSQPNRWLHWRRFEAVGGACAWRTRISDARKIAASKGGQIVHNGSNSRSAYRYIPAASEPRPHLWPIPGAPYGEAFKLTAPESH